MLNPEAETKNSDRPLTVLQEIALNIKTMQTEQ